MNQSEERFILRGVVLSTEERLMIEVIESEYAFGEYVVLLNEDTQFTDREGKPSSPAALAAGQTVEVVYGGQVMMSYPAQIVASRIQIL